MIYRCLFIFSLLFFNGLSAKNTLDSLKGVVHTNDSVSAYTYLYIAVLHYRQTYGYSKGEDSTLKYTALAKKRALETGEDSLRALSYFFEARALNREGKFEEAIVAGNTAKDIFISRGDSNMATKAQIPVAYAYQDLGLYDLAISNLEQAVQRAEAMMDTSSLAVAYSAIATIYTHTENYKESRAYSKKAMPLFKGRNKLIELGGMYNNLARAYTFEAFYDSAYTCYEKALNYWKEANFERGKAIVYDNLNEFYALQEQYDRSIDYSLKALEIFKEIGDTKKVIDSYLRLAYVYLDLGRVEKASDYVKLAETTAPDLIPFYSTLGLMEVKAKIFELKGDYKSAILYRNRHDAKKDSLDNRELQAKLDAFDRKVRFLNKIKEDKIEASRLETQQKSAELKQLKKNVVLASLFLILIISVIVLLYVYKKKKAERKALELVLKEKERTNRNLKEEVSLAKKKLSTYTLQMIDKNKKLTQLKRKLEETKEKLNDDDLTQQINLLDKELDQVRSSEQVWKEFKLYFEDVHVDFFSNIKQKHPALTNKELRLSALLRLNLTTKEVANLLNLPAKTIEVARYRLRKKLELSKEENLIDYIMSI